MKMHIDDEVLRAYLDRQLDHAPAVAAHLKTCPDCQARLAAMRARAARVRAHLVTLDPQPAEYARSPQLAFAQFTARRMSVSRKERFSMLKNIFSPRLRPLWVGLSIVAVLSIALSFAPVRAWAGNLLGLFRVQQIVVLPVDSTRLSELGNNSDLGKQISQLVSDSVTVTREGGKPQSVADAAQASQLAGFDVRLPASRSDAPQLSVESGSAFEFVVDRDRAQTLLNEAGLNQAQLPASLDGATVKVDIPAGVTAAYGDCPKPEEGDFDPDHQGSPGRRMANCIMLAEIPSPTVTTPPDMDVEQLAEIALQFSGMTAEQAHAFSQNVDWTSTLVVPIPRNGASYEEVAVDGVTGNLIRRPSDDAPQYLLMWVKDGTVYAIGGLGNDMSAALAMANSLQ
jgi:hypothetical protein